MVPDDVVNLISSFAERGIKLLPDGDGLIVEPASKLTDADERIIRTWKPQLLEYLTRAPERDRWPECARPPMPLRRCGALVCRTCHAHGPSPHRVDCPLPRFDPCHSRWFWLSPHGAIKCVACAAAADLGWSKHGCRRARRARATMVGRFPVRFGPLLQMSSPPQ